MFVASSAAGWESQHCQAGKDQLMAVAPSSNSHPKTSDSLTA